ncbi:Competence protein ComGC [Dethiosulfatibacter aminovorans DSM 17477]|uniref:Competence protein ComGC n=1 Tax=Dethiosulfatibacter aminovorans DSM 17477 TaxID=1121476 RepID=A0A1M6D8N2_9FIRM|nr:prepilin-type N-terminal cleavage/methylation domain-containing protein [Dethiosulfatibacter aminovorans]SHI69534.1 Competence protein ComGC [Dethiosulfatibacter aminovorans DSM 17477]
MDSKGYTLIELICIFALISILLLITVPNIDIDLFYLDKIAKEMTYDIRMVKSEDMLEPIKSFNIVLSDNGYSIKYSNGMPKYYKTVNLKDGYQIAFDNNSIMFNANGTPKHAQTITILHTSTGNKREITIVPYTGRILLLE